MIAPAYIRIMAQYNSEMNRRMYAAAAQLTDDQRRVDLGLFWQSLHGTLCHLLWADGNGCPASMAGPRTPSLTRKAPR